MDGLMKEYTPTSVQSAMKIARALHARLGTYTKSDSVGDNSDIGMPHSLRPRVLLLHDI